MLIELFAYISDQLATRIDWVVNENFIGTATQKKSVMRILDLIGYTFRLPIGAEVDVTVSLDRPIGDFFLSPVYQNDGQLTPYSLTAKDKSGALRVYEAIEYDDANTRFEYKTGISIDSGDAEDPSLIHHINFYEGVTAIQTFTADTDNNPIFTLSRNPVIENSVRVYLITTTGAIVTEEELTLVNSFLDPEAQRSTDAFGNDLPIAYVINVSEEDTVTVEFGPTSLLPDEGRRIRIDDQIRVFYRVGGGANGNLTKNSISTTKKLIIGSNIINATFLNELEGVGGQDGETAEHATIFAPLQIRTAQKAVTEDDYNILLNSNTTVLKARSYGNNNMPADLYSKYGVFIKPLEIWNFVLKDKPGWAEVDPSRWNDFRWITLRLENRFNEEHYFRLGEFDYESTAKTEDIIYSNTIDWSISDDDPPAEFKNYVLLEMPQDFIDNLYPGVNPNQYMRLKFTIEETGIEYFRALGEYNIFDEDITTNEGLLEGATPTWRIYSPMRAFFRSPVEISGNVNLSSNQRISLQLDNRPHLYGAFSYTGDTSIGSDIIDDMSTLAMVNLIPGMNIVGSGIPDDTFIIAVEPSLYRIQISNNATLNQNNESFDFSFDINIAGVVPGTTQPEEIRDKINTYFLNNPVYNNGSTGIKGYQEFGLTVDATADSGLATETTYYIWINGREYNITTGDTGPFNYNDVVDLLKTGLSFSYTGDTINGSDLIKQINKNFAMTKIKKGMRVTGDGIPSDTFVIEVFEEQNMIEISNNATLDQATETFTFYPYEVTVQGVSPNQDIRIQNPEETPVGPLWLNKGTSGNDLFVSLNGHPADFDPAISGSGPVGYQEFGLDIADTATSGYQEVGMDVVGPGQPSGLNILTWYYFEVNGTEYEIQTGPISPTYAEVIALILPANRVGGGGTFAGDGFNCTFETNDIRIANTLAGAASTITLAQGSLPHLFENLAGWDGAFDPAIDGVDATVSGLIMGTTYYFTVNGYEYSFTPPFNDPTYTQIAGYINSETSPLHTAALVGGSPHQDIRVTSSINSQIDLGNGVSGTPNINNLFWLDDGVTPTILNGFTALDEPIGGGDYSAVARIVIDSSYNEYMRLESPNKGEFTSKITFWRPTVDDATYQVFQVALADLPVISRSKTNYGYQRATIVTNKNLTDEFGNVLFENGSLRFISTPKDFYVNYLLTDADIIYIGKYHNENYTEDDPAHRERANRIYNTVYDTDTLGIDFTNSDFHIKLTKDPTESLSVFSITNDWTLQEASPAIVYSISDPGAIGNLDPANHRIKVNIDTHGWVEIDITGDNGVDIGGDGYELVELVDNINGAIRNSPGYDGLQIYGTFAYARISDDGEKVILSSPINDNNSRIDIGVPTINDATLEFFGLVEGESYVYTVEGDYFLGYDSIEDLMTLNRVTASTFTSNLPDLTFYLHFVFDKRFQEDLYEEWPEGSLDEDIYDASLENNKIVGLNHAFKQTKITVFDIKGTIYYNKVYSAVDVEQRVITKLEDQFNLLNRDYREPVARSKVMSIIHEVDGVDYVEIDYLGIDATDSTSNVENTIPCSFDEILVLSEDRFLGGEQIHGLNFDYRISAI